MTKDQLPPNVAFHRTLAERSIRFGPFRFDLVDRTLSRDGQEVRLPPRASAILQYLLERPGRIVSKQELLDVGWKDAFVSESSLTEAVGVLRQVLGDTAAEATFIQTVHRRGYRFVAPIRIEAPSPTVLKSVALQPEIPGELPGVAKPAWRPQSVALMASVILLAAAGVWLYFRPTAPVRVTRTTITLPEGLAPAPGLSSHTVAALAPDGTRLVYVAGTSGSYRLFLRALDQFEAIPIPGTDLGHGPFFSPNGTSIGFFRQGRLLIMRLPDGQPLDLGPSGAGHSGWWHSDDTILFATGTADGVLRVSANGGQATPIAVSGLNPAALRHPTLTADARTMLATNWKQNVRESEIVAVNLAQGTAHVLAKGVHPSAVLPGYAIYLRDNNLMAVAVAGGGQETPLLTGVMTGATGAGQYAVAAEGTLLYIPHEPSRTLRQLKHVRSDGSMAAMPFEQRPYQNFALSPDGTRIAVTIHEGGAADLWMGENGRGALLRLTTEGGVVDPVWSPDGRTIFYGAMRSGVFRIHRIAADGSGQPSVVGSLENVSPASATEAFLLAQRVERGNRDIVRLAFDGTWSDWLATRASEGAARVSPDGRYVIYESNRSGRMEIYLRRLDGGAERQVSTEGGSLPFWSQDGRSITFTNRRRVFRVRMGESLGTPEQLYEDPKLLLASGSGHGLIVLAALEETRPLTTLNVVGNWLADVRPRLQR